MKKLDLNQNLTITGGCSSGLRRRMAGQAAKCQNEVSRTRNTDNRYCRRYARMYSRCY